MSPQILEINIDSAARLHEEVKVAAYYIAMKDNYRYDQNFYYYLGQYELKRDQWKREILSKIEKKVQFPPHSSNILIKR